MLMTRDGICVAGELELLESLDHVHINRPVDPLKIASFCAFCSSAIWSATQFPAIQEKPIYYGAIDTTTDKRRMPVTTRTITRVQSLIQVQP